MGKIVSKAGGEQMLQSPELKPKVDAEVRRIAIVLAKWQTNGHSFGKRADDCADWSALYHFGSKMLHSCEPNCERSVCPDTGRLIVSASRAIGKGEHLTIDYMG